MGKEMLFLRKKVLVALICICAILSYFTFVSAKKAFRSDWQPPSSSGTEAAQYRLVLITHELETPFWDRVAAGALEQARKEGASLEVWGSYGNNQAEFLRLFEVAIYSKVDGIIVQGLDTEEFENLTKVKAAFYGIPVITVAHDVPMEKSLRKTYVGSDQYKAGKMIAEQLLSDLGSRAKVILMSDNYREHYQQQRLSGIQDVLADVPDVQTVYAETPESWERVVATTQELMNQVPDANAFIAINANIAEAMLQEIGRRSRIEPYHIYSFDDSPHSQTLLASGKLDGMIRQSPEEMGKVSVERMIGWLSGKTVPLDAEGYFTGIEMVKAVEAP